MGAPMLRALRDAGFDARGFDVRAPSEFGDLEPIMFDDPYPFGRDLDVLFTVVRDAEQTDDVLFGNGNLIGRSFGLDWLIVSSTLSPRYVTELRARIPDRVRLIDAPMSGAEIAAIEKRLSFMIGGWERDIDTMQPLFDAMGSHFHRMGAYGAGMQTKVLNNLLAASNTAMTRMVLDWADQAEVDPAKLLQVMHTSSGQNWFASGFNEIEFSRDGWEPDNTIGILTKDVDAALDAAPDGADTALPEAVKAMIRSLSPRG